MVDSSTEMERASAPTANSRSEGGSFAAADATMWALILMGALFRIVSYWFSANNGGDANTHAAIAAKWLQHPTLRFVFEVYPPGHFWLIGLSALLIRDVETAARLLSLVLGIASLIAVWKLSDLLYGRQAAALSLGAFSMYSLHIGYSTTSSAEVPYLFFFLVGAYFFFRYAASADKIFDLIVSGIALSISESIRFEAWILFAGLCVILVALLWAKPLHRLSLRDRIRAVFLFGVSGGAWPVFMMVYSWHAFQNPMYLVTQNRLRVTSYLGLGGVSRAYQFALLPSAILISLSVVAVIGAIYGIVLSFSSRLTTGFAGLTLFFSAVQVYEVFSGGLLATARYTITLGTLLAIISGYGLQRICEQAVPKRMSPAQGLVLGLLLLNLVGVLAASEFPNRYAEKIASVSPRLRYSTSVEGVGGYLRSHLGPDDAVVFDGYNFESGILADASGLPLLPGRRAYLGGNRNAGDVHDYIRNQHPKFLVYAEQGTLAHSLPLPEGCEESDMDGVHFRCLFKRNMYRIYELSYR